MHRILIVDDEESIRFAMSEYFKTHGYLVDCAQDVREAEANLTCHSYSVVIADLRLEGLGDIGGLEVVRLVEERYPETRVIVLSAYGAPEVEEETGRYGIRIFLRKPQPLPEVAQIVLGLLEVDAGRSKGLPAVR
ncbi:MAG TPA: response regulator [Blastocatellia bacterium]|nr:response regulator [Blastocatellia bacterium]